MNEKLAQVEAEMLRLNTVRDEIKEQLHALALRRDVLIAEQAAADLLAGLSPSVRDALAQSITAGGIASGESFGVPR